MPQALFCAMSTSHEDIVSAATVDTSQIVTHLLSSKNVLITTHINPDGDALGSALGLCHWLRANAVQARVMLPNVAPSNLLWLPGADAADVWAEDKLSCVADADTIVVLDLNAVTRLGTLGSAIVNASATIINIDHHTHPENFASIAWIDTEACSTCFMISTLILSADTAVDLPAAAAACLYTGIMTDTGSFRFPRTTSAVFKTVAALLEKGADPVAAYDKVMNQGSVGRTQLLGKTLSQMSVLAGGRLCVMTVRQQDMHDYSCTVEDIEGFVQQTLTLRGVEMGILLVELPTEIKLSFRSKGNAYVRDLAAAYGGGGHVYAAGARVQGTLLDQIADDVMQRAVNYLENT
jgi:phosphoesterase RecJ-like protein